MSVPLTVTVDIDALQELLAARINTAVSLYADSADFTKFLETTVKDQVDEAIRAIVSASLAEMFTARQQEFVDRATTIAIQRAQDFFASLDKVR